MAEKELVFKLKFVDENGSLVDKTATSIKDINKSIKDLKSELENTELGSEQWNDLASDLGKAENAMEKVGEASTKAKESQKGFSDSMSSLPGPIGGVIKGAKAMNAALMKLVLNPIGAVIAAVVLSLTALYKAFTSTKAGGEKMEQVMAGISAVMDVVRDRVLLVGGAIVKFFSGDFSGAMDDAKASVSGFGDELVGEFKKAAEIKRELQSIADAQRELNNQRAIQNMEIAKAKLVINDETKSYKERQIALEQVRQAEIALSKQEEILAQRRYEAIKAQNALSDSSKEALDEEAQAYQNLLTIQQTSLQKQKAVFDQQKALRDRERNEQKAAIEKRKQELQELLDFRTQINLDLYENEKDRIKEEIKLRYEDSVRQINELKTTEQEKEELRNKVGEKRRREETELQRDIYSESLDLFDGFRQQLIDSQLAYDQLDIQRAERLMNIELDRVDDMISIEDDLQGILYNIQRGNFEKVGELSRTSVDNRQDVLDNINEIEKEQLSRVLGEYDDYYATLKFQEDQRLERDSKNGEQREEERKKQLESAKVIAKLEYDNEIKLMEEKHLSNQDRLFEQMRLESEMLISQHIETNKINDYFDDYNVNRQKEYNDRITDLTTEKEDKQTEIVQKFSDLRSKINDQEFQKQQNQIQLVGDGLSVLSQYGKDNAEYQKALAYAQTIFDTYLGAQKAYVSQLIPGDITSIVRAQIAAGIAIAGGLARAMAIRNTNIDEPSAADGLLVGQGSGRMDNMKVNVSNGESIINARSTQRFKPLLSAINMAGGGKSFSGGFSQTQTSSESTLLNQLVNKGQSPMKTYVVSTEVSSSVSLDRQIKSRSVL